MTFFFNKLWSYVDKWGKSVTNMPGSRIRHQSTESKKLVKCGKDMRRDNLKSIHVPKQHPGKAYFESGEKKLTLPGHVFRVQSTLSERTNFNSTKCDKEFQL